MLVLPAYRYFTGFLHLLEQNRKLLFVLHRFPFDVLNIYDSNLIVPRAEVVPAGVPGVAEPAVARIEQELHSLLVAPELGHEGVGLGELFRFPGFQKRGGDVEFLVADEGGFCE